MAAEKRRIFRDAWQLTKPYWQSEDKLWAWGLLVVVVALNLATVYLSVRLNTWRNDFFNTLQNFDEKAFFHQLLIFSILAGLFIVFGVYQLYLQQMLQIRWRRWLTRRYLDAWLGERAYYRLELDRQDGTDNPDQRISDDLERFTRETLALSVGGSGLLNSVVTLGSFLLILWNLSGSMPLDLGSWGRFEIPGYMLWIAVLYSIAGTWLTFKIGRPLVGLNFQQQRLEADFRFSMVRLRENTESVALYGGEARERGTFLDRFVHVVDNFWTIMRRVKRLGWFTYGYGQFAVIIPYIVAAPRYFAKQMELGGLMQTADAFGQVQGSLSFIVSSYTDIAEWQSVVERLKTFDERLNAIAAAAHAPQRIDLQPGAPGLQVSGLELDLPDGTPLLRGVTLAAAPGEAVLIGGPTGSGKSTLLRAIAGIWPFGEGEIRLGAERSLFLPQRPYLPLGSLRETLLYPRPDDDVPDERLGAALEEVGLGSFRDQIGEGSNWAKRLSLGEQQRLAFARILLTRPAIVFLDEATSALDEPSEAMLYRLLRTAPWHPTLVSVGHRSTLREFHDRFVDISRFTARQPAPLPAA